MKALDDKRKAAMETLYFQAQLRRQLEKIKPVMNQDAVASEVGISGPYLSDIKNSKKPGTEEIRRKIAGFFKMELEEFIEGGRRVYEEEIRVSEGQPEYGPQQFNFFGNRVTDLKSSDDYMDEYPKLVNYLDAFRSAMKTGSKRLMLATLEELKGYIEKEEEE